MRDVNINEIIIMIKSSFEERNYREILLRAYSEIFSPLNSQLIDEMDRYIQYLDEELELLKKQEKDEKKTERIENKFKELRNEMEQQQLLEAQIITF